MTVRIIKNEIPGVIAALESAEMEAVLAAATKPIAEMAQARVPVATGELRDSIEVKPAGSGNVGIFMAWYGAFVERGTVKQPAHPFLVPAAEAGKAEVAAAVTTFLRALT